MGSHVRTRQLPLVGIVAKEPCKRDHVRGKRHLILRSLLIVATPYHIIAFYDVKRKKEPLVGVVAKEPYKREIVAKEPYTYIHLCGHVRTRQLWVATYEQDEPKNNPTRRGTTLTSRGLFAGET